MLVQSETDEYWDIAQNRGNVDYHHSVQWSDLCRSLKPHGGHFENNNVFNYLNTAHIHLNLHFHSNYLNENMFCTEHFTASTNEIEELASSADIEGSNSLHILSSMASRAACTFNLIFSMSFWLKACPLCSGSANPLCGISP